MFFLQGKSILKIKLVERTPQQSVSPARYN